MILIIYLKGESAGSSGAESKAKSETIDNVNEAKKVADDVSAMPANDRRDRLRDYSKK